MHTALKSLKWTSSVVDCIQGLLIPVHVTHLTPGVSGCHMMDVLLRPIRVILRLVQVCGAVSIFLNLLCCCFSDVLPVLIAAASIQFLLGVITQPCIADLQKRAVLITGCDTGIGNALARRLDNMGMRVFAACLKADGPGAESLKLDCSKRLMTIQMDVTKDEEVEQAKETIEDELSGDLLWGVVNNAGIVVLGEMEWLSADVYRHVLDVNVLGMIRVTQQFLPLLRVSRGRVVNACSVQGRFASPISSTYCISKFGVEALGDALRYELHKWGIKVITMEPGNFALASSQFQQGHLRSSFKRVWDNMKPAVREAYGKGYFDAITSLMLDVPQSGSGNIDIVLDDYVKALTHRHPASRYMPASLAWKILPLVLYLSPSWVGDILFLKLSPMTSYWDRTRPGSQ